MKVLFVQKESLFEEASVTACPHNDGGEKRQAKRSTGGRADWRFALLAEFEDMLKEYGQDHFSSQE